MSSPESDRPATPAAASTPRISMKASIKVSAVIDSWKPADYRKFEIRNHNDASSYRMDYVANTPTLKIAPVDERDLLGEPMKRVASRMAAAASFDSPRLWIENNREMLRVLAEEIKACRIATYREMVASQAADRFMAEMIIESVEAGDDKDSMLLNTAALKERYAQLFQKNVQKVMDEKLALSGKGPFGAFRVVR